MLNSATQAGRRGAYRNRTNLLPAVKRRRLDLGLTQSECATRCGVSLRTFQRVEARDAVPIPVVRQVERALGIGW